MALPILQTLALAPVFLLAYAFLRIVYNIFLHPLRSFPGPLLARATILTSQRIALAGVTPAWLHRLHQKYGPVVRYAPNELSFIEADTWKDVYGHRATAFEKQKDFYGPDAYGSPPGLIRADKEAHARQRKLVSHAFSDKALREQEILLKGYAELLVSQLKKQAAKEGSKADMVAWYNFTTFDIMADLTFGDSLHLLEESKYTPWVKSIFGNIQMTMLTSVIRRWKLLNNVFQKFIPQRIKQQRVIHMQHSSSRVDQRLARKTDRPDIWTYVMRYSDGPDNEIKGLHPTEMHSNGALFMLAGTETTATELSGMTYYLLKNPEKLRRLQTEIREAFTDFGDLTMTSLSQLEYLNAVVEEGLRVYPPVPVGLPRSTPPGGARIAGRWVPGGTAVSLAQWAAYRSPGNFKNPDDFVPERWMPEGQGEYGGDNKDVLNPFSYGPRNCLGKNLAYHEMRLVLASVMLNFDMELCEESDGWTDQLSYVLWHKGPLNVKLTPVS